MIAAEKQIFLVRVSINDARYYDISSPIFNYVIGVN